MIVLVCFSALLFLCVGYFLFIRPSIRFVKSNVRHIKKGESLPIMPVEILGIIVFPILGHISLFAFNDEAELLDPKYIDTVWWVSILSALAYFASRLYKHVLPPLVLMLLPSLLVLGSVLALVQFVHFVPVALVAAAIFVFLIFVLPIFSLLQISILMSVEVYALVQESKIQLLKINGKSPAVEWLINVYYGKNFWIYQLITFPLFISIVQFVLVLFSQKPDDIVQAFIESSDGVFSDGSCDECNRNNQEYICTIAGFGSAALVKPIHMGRRAGVDIRVNRQLKVCNAFEELMEERTPRMHRFLRKKYDDLQIPIHKWKNVKWAANGLFLFIKPMEWSFLVLLYLLEKNPEVRIGRQYLPARIQNLRT